MKLTKLGFLSIIFLLSNSASAGWFQNKIATIHTYTNGGISVFTESNHECGSNRIGFDNTAPGFQRVYSALLAYEAQGKEVKFAIQSCSGTTAIADRIVSVN